MKKRNRRPKERPDVPEEESRPDARELAGTSESTVRSAGSTPPAREGREAHRRDREAEVEPGPPAHDELSVEPSDLGRRYLEGATQQPRHERERAQTERESTGEEPIASMGERAMRGRSPGASDEKDRLVTEMPDRTEHEERISRETRERQKKEPPEKRRESKI